MKPGVFKTFLNRAFYTLLTLIVLFLIGPRVSTQVGVRENDLPDSENLVEYLEKKESQLSDLIPDDANKDRLGRPGKHRYTNRVFLSSWLQ